MKFHLIPLEFDYEAVDSLYFPAGKLTNIVRGALGLDLRAQGCRSDCLDSKECPAAGEEGPPCLYQQLFEGQTGEARPSGYREAPRPFVLRSANWAEHALKPGDRLVTALNLFDLRGEILRAIVRAHVRIGARGLAGGGGQQRGRLRLREIRQPEGGSVLWRGEAGGGGAVARPGMLSFELAAEVEDAPQRVRVEFLTPTEIKSGGVVRPDAAFATLFPRLRERILFLISHYGEGGWAGGGGGDPEGGGGDDGLLDAARRIVTVRQDLREVMLERYSTRTGQTHPLSGFVGEAVYEGDFRRLWPWLLASQWCGVGRQTVWGKGDLRWSG